MFGDTPEDENADKEIVIPTEVKPLMKKNVNFKLYCDMLMEKNDKQRVNIDLNQFCKIRFSNCGLPEIIVRLFSFLAQELPAEMAKKKSTQLFGASTKQGINLQLKIAKSIKENGVQNEVSIDEFKNLKYVYEKLKDKINMNIYLKFFRSFCRQPEDIEIKNLKKYK